MDNQNAIDRIIKHLKTIEAHSKNTDVILRDCADIAMRNASTEDDAFLEAFALALDKNVTNPEMGRTIQRSQRKSEARNAFALVAAIVLFFVMLRIFSSNPQVAAIWCHTFGPSDLTSMHPLATSSAANLAMAKSAVAACSAIRESTPVSPVGALHFSILALSAVIFGRLISLGLGRKNIITQLKNFVLYLVPTWMLVWFLSSVLT